MIKVVSPDGEVFHVPPGTKIFDSMGREILDPTPLEVPTGYGAPESLESMMLRMIHGVSAQASRAGVETLEEANDYEVDDDEDFADHLTGHELRAMVEATPMTEEVVRDDSERSAGRTGRREEDRDSGEESQSDGSDERGRSGERDSDASERGGASDDVDRGSERRRESQTPAKGVGVGTQRKKR